MNRIKILFYFACFFTILSCMQYRDDKTSALNKVAEDYVKLGLFIGQYDGDFVDAYYGPDSLKPSNKPATFPKDSILSAIDAMQDELKNLASQPDNETRAKWLLQQLTAFGRRVRIYSGESGSFDEECKELFGVIAPEYPESHYQKLIDSLDRLLPGNGSVQERFQQLANQFIISKEKLDTVFKASIAEARKRTLRHYALPADETFRLSLVSNKPWNGYNWYKGNYNSEIQINTDLQIFIERAIDVGSHESYPGHHVYNMLLEKNLYRDKGWVEISLYPLFSPQSFIAEGSANYGIELAFPGDDRRRFATDVLLPLAGLDTAGTNLYFEALAIRAQLNYARNEAARGLINHTMNETDAISWLEKYCLYNKETALKSIAFIKKYRSYVINYNYGQDVVKKYIGSRPPSQSWEIFGDLLGNPVLTEDLVK